MLEAELVKAEHLLSTIEGILTEEVSNNCVHCMREDYPHKAYLDKDHKEPRKTEENKFVILNSHGRVPPTSPVYFKRQPRNEIANCHVPKNHVKIHNYYNTSCTHSEQKDEKISQKTDQGNSNIHTQLPGTAYVSTSTNTEHITCCCIDCISNSSTKTNLINDTPIKVNARCQTDKHKTASLTLYSEAYSIVDDGPKKTDTATQIKVLEWSSEKTCQTIQEKPSTCVKTCQTTREESVKKVHKALQAEPMDNNLQFNAFQESLTLNTATKPKFTLSSFKTEGTETHISKTSTLLSRPLKNEASCMRIDEPKNKKCCVCHLEKDNGSIARFCTCCRSTLLSNTKHPAKIPLYSNKLCKFKCTDNLFESPDDLSE